MSHTHLLYSARHAFVATLLIAVLGVCSFFAFEPSVGRAITDEFTVTQEITDEISFSTFAQNVAMEGSITGLSGGFATGSTMAVIRSNDAQGYTMKLHFSTTSSGRSMQASSTAYINDYSPAVASVADFHWITNSSGGAAEFGYSVTASNTAEVDLTFLNDGASACATGSSNTANRCWINPTTSPETLVSSTGPTAASTTTIKFKVAVPNAPSPALPTGFYLATGTLTATNNP